MYFVHKDKLYMKIYTKTGDQGETCLLMAAVLVKTIYGLS